MKPIVTSTYRFMVEIDGIIVGGFSEVQGLQANVEIEEYMEGGRNEYSHRLPKRITYSNLILRKGISNSDILWKWYKSVLLGFPIRKDGSVILYREDDEELCRWNFIDLLPIKWTGSDLNASASEIAIETFEFVHNGFKMKHSRTL